MNTVFYFEVMFHNYIEGHISIPETEDYKKEEFPHYHVFMLIHLGRVVNLDSLEENAKVIAGFTTEEIKTATMSDFIDKGLYIETSDYIV